jgi:hypothetical protein
MNTPSENNSADDVYNRIISAAEKYDPFEIHLSFHHLYEDKRKLKKEWKENIEKRRKDPNFLLKHYCYEIRNEVDPCDETFEEYVERLEESWKSRQEDHKLEIALSNHKYALLNHNQKPKGMSNAEYNAKRKELRRQRRQENKERKADQAIEHNTPFWILWNKIRIISCQCKAEGLRQGIYCDTCKLLLISDNHMMDLFKDVAQGRRTV